LIQAELGYLLKFNRQRPKVASDQQICIWTSIDNGNVPKLDSVLLLAHAVGLETVWVDIKAPWRVRPWGELKLAHRRRRASADVSRPTSAKARKRKRPTPDKSQGQLF
jgi:hypothetical protein